MDHEQYTIKTKTMKYTLKEVGLMFNNEMFILEDDLQLRINFCNIIIICNYVIIYNVY